MLGDAWWSKLTTLTAAAIGTFFFNQNSVAPTVILNGTVTVVGVTNTYGQETFLGIPYAQPPVGLLRYAVPAPALLNSSIQASAFGPVCMQDPWQNVYNLSSMSEDCLSINVFRPAGLPASAKLPVLVWIYGGAFLTGGSAQYDPAPLVERGIQLGEPVIYVSFNYRLNSFGFLASSVVATAAKNGTATLNAGLYDIQAALLWIQQNIDSFGGDHTKVTVFGESAGAFSIGSLLVAGGGESVEKLNLFRGAIMESGAPSGDGSPAPSYFDPAYQSFASLGGCGPALLDGTSLACLRGLNTSIAFNATLNLVSQYGFVLPFGRVMDGYFHDILPSAQVRAGRLANVPLMMGNNLDEGTIFSPPDINTSDVLVPVLTGSFADKNAPTSFYTTILPELLALYPDDPALGSPFAPLNVSKSERFYPPLTTNQYKRFSAIVGDAFLQAGRRILLDAYILKDKDAPVYNYLFTANTPGADPALGVYHGSEVPFVYGEYVSQHSTDVIQKTSLFMMDSWIAFTNNLDPNRPNLPAWPKYGLARNTIQIGTETQSGEVTQLIQDTYRADGMAFLGGKPWSDAVNI